MATPPTSAPSTVAVAIARIIVLIAINLASSQTAEESLSCTTYSVIPQICLGLTDFLPLSVGVLGQLKQLAEILGCLLAVVGTVGSPRRSPEPAETIGGLLERSLELVQGGCRLPYLEEQFRQQFSEREEAVLHRHVFEAAVFTVS